MNKRIMLPMLLVAFVVSDASAQNRFHRRRGTVVGGIAGAAIGAAIGDDKGNAAAGAIIGGVAGAAAGNAIGGRRDRRIEGQYYHSQPTPAQGPSYYQPHVFQPQPQSPVYVDGRLQPMVQRPETFAVSMEDVVMMVRRGINEGTIIEQIRVNGVQHRLNVRDIIFLHEQGVSERILNEMQIAPLVVLPAEGPLGPSVLQPSTVPHSAVPAPPKPWNSVPAN